MAEEIKNACLTILGSNYTLSDSLRNELLKIIDEAEEEPSREIRQQLTAEFPQWSEQIKRLTFGFENEGQIQDQGCIYIESSWSRNDIDNLYPQDYFWLLEIYYAKEGNKNAEGDKLIYPLFHYYCNVVQSHECNSSKIYFDEAVIKKQDVTFYTEDLPECIDLSFLLQISLETLTILFGNDLKEYVHDLWEPFIKNPTKENFLLCQQEQKKKDNQCPKRQRTK